jgi:hypothetical protein
VFSSFSPDVCAALNWKQPNCEHLLSLWLNVSSLLLYVTLPSDPVFFASLCGREDSVNPSPAVLAHAEAGGERLSSLASAVRFSKANNLLGVIVAADILVSTYLTTSHLRFHVAHRLFSSYPPILLSCHSKINPYIIKRRTMLNKKFHLG